MLSGERPMKRRLHLVAVSPDKLTPIQGCWGLRSSTWHTSYLVGSDRFGRRDRTMMLFVHIGNDVGCTIGDGFGGGDIFPIAM